MHTPVTVVLLAGGAGKRMQSGLQKVLHPLCGLPMLDWVRKAAELPKGWCDEPPIAIVGFGREQLMDRYGESLRYVMQTRPRGSGSALLDARDTLRGVIGRTLVLAGDLPLLRADTIRKLVELESSAAFLTSYKDTPYGHGRVLRDYEGAVQSIIEEEALTEEQWTLQEVRVSAYSFDNAILISVLDEIAEQVGLGECSMGDILGAFIQKGYAAETISIPEEEAEGVNDRIDLARCERILRMRINEKHMRNGVSMVNPEATYIDATVKLGRDCLLYPGVVLEGNTVVEEGTILYPGCHLFDTHIGKFCQARGVVTRSAVVEDYVTMGPYVHLRPNARLKNRVKVGNYIEVKNATVGEGSKLPHLSYIGDGEIGTNSNLGCGTVFVNYDGYQKHRTKIGNNVFIGCHTSLVAPVSVGDGSFTAAGSVITEDVPAETLAVARAKQVNKVNYMAKLKAKRGDG